MEEGIWDNVGSGVLNTILRDKQMGGEGTQEKAIILSNFSLKAKQNKSHQKGVIGYHLLSFS